MERAENGFSQREGRPLFEVRMLLLSEHLDISDQAKIDLICFPWMKLLQCLPNDNSPA